MRTDDATNHSEQTATAFTVSKLAFSFANPWVEILVNVAKSLVVSFRRIVTIEQLQLTQTHTVSFTLSLVRVRLEA